MKKAQSGNRSAKAKRVSSPKTVDEYLSSLPESTRRQLQQLRATIRSVVPRDATETISYHIPAFKSHVILVWFAAFSDHCSLFPTAAVIAEFKDELKGYSTSKGTIHFPLDKPLPIALVRKIVKERVLQADSRKRS